MKLTLRQQLTQFAHTLQSQLFPVLEEATGPLDRTARRLIAILEMVPLGRFVPSSRGWMGRPSKERYAIASAFVAKSVYGMAHTRQLIERLRRTRSCAPSAASPRRGICRMSPRFRAPSPSSPPWNCRSSYTKH